MSLTVVSARDPKYVQADEQAIELIVQFAEIAEELPFNAMPTDSMPYGVELFNNAKAGLYGPVAPYVPPPTEPSEIPVTQA
jgi:hypothetical protein